MFPLSRFRQSVPGRTGGAIFLFALVVCAFPVAAQTAENQILSGSNPDLLGGCFRVPPIDTTKDFVGNFNNSCYAIPLVTSRGADKAGDLNALYSEVFYKVTPGYDLVVLGNFPNSRFLSVTAYDGHAAVTSEILDTAILPLNTSMFNPFTTAAPYQPNQQYGIRVSFGSGPPSAMNPGCNTLDTTIDQNVLDASKIHAGIDWTGYPGLPPGFPAHQTGANGGGAVFVRSYYDISGGSSPVIIARNLSTGCAVPARDATEIVTTGSSGGGWSNGPQVQAHLQFSNQIEQIRCFPQDPLNKVRWTRSGDYVPGNNGAAAYLNFRMSSSLVDSIIRGKQFIRMQFQVPALPNIPCTDGTCGLSGADQMRYRSISFLNTKTTTFLSVKDADMVKDSNGNVTLIIGLGTDPPPNVTAANYYTYVDLSKIRGYRNVAQVAMRDILPSASFDCSSFNVPYFTTEYNPEGGYMGGYVPTVDFPTGSQLPTFPAPIARPDSCAAAVTQVPVACGTQSGG